MSAAPSLQLDTASLKPASTHAASSRPSPSALAPALTTFPNPFTDEPEPGLIPSFLSKVKSTFTGTAITAAVTPVAPPKAVERGPLSVMQEDEGGSASALGYPGAQTEAQRIVAESKERAASGKTTSPIPVSLPPLSIGSSEGPSPRGSRQSIGTVEVPTSPQRVHSGQRSLRPPPTVASSQSGSRPPSLTRNDLSSGPAKRLIPPDERRWRPAGAAPAQVTVSPVTSVTTTVQASGNAEAGPSAPPTTQRAALRAHFGLQAAVNPPLSHSPSFRKHAHRDSLSSLRPRRSSFATIPDSPSSVSLSAMVHNAELNQNMSYVPGFPLGQDDTRSVRSLGMVKKTNSVSRIIRRIRGEGLSKHYWMADEHCKECYDCKSVFTAWRRKHHCRICGQIFCSRCASNIIGARRFGQDGAVRVCNLCLKIMEEYRDDDDDDRHSIASMATSARMPSMSDRAFLEAAMSPDMTSHAKSPFAASQLFSTNPDDTLDAIEEGVATRWDAEGGTTTHRPYSPDGSEDEDEGIWTMRPNTAIPFRRPMEEDQKEIPNADSDTGSISAHFEDSSTPSTPMVETSEDAAIKASTEESSPTKPVPPKAGDGKKRVEFPRSDTISSDGGDRPPLSRVDSNAPLIGLRSRLSSRTSQGGLTALIDEKGDGLWRARSNSFVKRPEILSGSSLHHFHLMLEQAIVRSGLDNAAEWHHTLSGILLKVSSHIRPNVRAGDFIDVRAYVKIKKVPGGKISDSEYVDGIVISKNVAHKAMARRLVNPRIMIVTFPLDYHRIEHQFMSLDPIMAQEKDYLRLLTRRIIDVRPHIVLVERSASRLALDHLLEAGIAVARSVKLSAIHQVARCTQADVIASMDRLALEPRLGRCAEFRIQSFDHDLIPGRRKTLMRFEGCQQEFGCTIILRGGDIPTLRKVKIIADFMAFVVYQLKNEVILYSDEHNIPPIRSPLSTEYQQLLAKLAEKEILGPAHSKESTLTIGNFDAPVIASIEMLESIEDDRQLERKEAGIQTREIALSLEPYLTTLLSASVSIRFPPPMPLAKMAELDRNLAVLRRKRDEEEAKQILQEEMTDTRKPPSQLLDIDMSGTGATAPESAASSISEKDGGSHISIPASGKSRARDPYRVLRKPEEISRESTLAQVEHDHAEQIKLWQWYIRRHSGVLRPEDHQGIVYLYSLGCEGGEKPCVEPKLEHINFYQPDDSTVGQFLESLAADAGHQCPSKTCERLLLFHFRLLVHGARRLQIAIDQFPCPSPGDEDRIITWSYCRLCATPSPTTIMRDETWKMSWGAYLEHCFYPPETPAGFSCPHDAYRDQIRYFAHRNLAIRIHNEKIDVYEPVRPSITLQTKPETKVLLKNQEYESILHKNTLYFDSVLFRLRAFDYDICQPDKVGSLREALEAMLSRAVADREELVNLLNRTYKLTPMTDVLALNTVLRTLQDKVVQWDSDFADIEKTFLPSEKDLRRMTASHLKRLFAAQDGFGSVDRNVVGLTVSEGDEREGKEIEGEGGSGSTRPTTPAGEDHGLLSIPAFQHDSGSVSSSSSPGDGITPMNVVVPVRSMSLPPTAEDDGTDSDSTIGAKQKGAVSARPSPNYGLGIESSEMDSDGYFVSRLPRRAKPAASIADLVKRFQESSAQFEANEEVQLERPKSSSSIRRNQRHRLVEPSDTDDVPIARPRLRRGKTEQLPPRHRDVSRSGLISDTDRGYAHHASRIPTIGTARRSFMSPELRPNLRTRTSEMSGSSNVSAEATVEPSLLAPAAALRSAGEGKPRPLGRGKVTRAESAPRVSTTAARPSNKRNLTVTPGNRVTSIARHFDRLSREAERERQKRISMVRNKRARPVAATKVKEQVFDNLRDAFRDEFDTDSSEADNEEDDEHGSDDSADSGGEMPERKKKSPSKSPKKSPVKAVLAIDTSMEPLDLPDPIMIPSVSPDAALPPADGVPISGSGQSIASTSVTSDAKSEISFTDRLQIDLPVFETSAPLPSVPATPNLSVDTGDEGGVQPNSHVSQLSESEMSSGGERSSILKTLTGLWAFRAGDYTPLEYPLSAAEHIFADSRVIIRENEPTSIIAFTLSSKTYREKMRDFLSAKQKTKKEAFMPEEASNISIDRSSMWDIVSLDEAIEADDTSRREGGTHLKYDFDSGSSTIFCRIFFAEQFAALRSACKCEDSFVESLARCVQFDASGGKSGSAFLKTRDDRFICKEISRLEMDALTKFAPAYFEYTRKAFQGQRPTVLAKVYGFFKIGYRNAVTGRAMRMNVLVMENLFYERRFSKIYDLKGSTRNRLIQATGKINEVLLDENLMEIVYKHPLYLREHSKRILRSALFNDTLFLSNLNVMDYSLVVGVDQDRHELVIGIVDYIRTFTWDKKLESWVKDSAFLGGAGKGEPTIVTPKQYKTRFRTAMDKNYFLAVPDRWSKVGAEEDAAETDTIATTS